MTVPLPSFATQILVPSKATPYGRRRPRWSRYSAARPVAASSLVTLLLVWFVTQI